MGAVQIINFVSWLLPAAASVQHGRYAVNASMPFHYVMDYLRVALHSLIFEPHKFSVEVRCEYKHAFSFSEGLHESCVRNLPSLSRTNFDVWEHVSRFFWASLV